MEDMFGNLLYFMSGSIVIIVIFYISYLTLSKANNKIFDKIVAIK